MKEKLFASINVASYFLWEYSQSDNALGLWCCAEDIANMFQKKGITNLERLNAILILGKKNEEYIQFLRDISYKIYSYTKNIDHIKNWFLAEALINNSEWINAILTAAEIYNNIKGEDEVIKSIRSESVRNFYIQR